MNGRAYTAFGERSPRGVQHTHFELKVTEAVAAFEYPVLVAVRDALNLPLDARMRWFADVAVAVAVARANAALPAPSQADRRLLDGEQG